MWRCDFLHHSPQPEIFRHHFPNDKYIDSLFSGHWSFFFLYLILQVSIMANKLKMNPVGNISPQISLPGKLVFPRWVLDSIVSAITHITTGYPYLAKSWSCAYFVILSILKFEYCSYIVLLLWEFLWWWFFFC